MIKNTYSIQLNNPGQLFFRGKRKLLKNSEYKNIFHTVKFFRAPSVFQGKRWLLKNPE